MINLSSIFSAANNQSEKQRDVLVMVEDETLLAEKTTETDWGNNTSESQVDYTASPPDAGDVTLAEGSIIENHETFNQTWGDDYNGGFMAQSFKHSLKTTIGKVSLSMRARSGNALAKIIIREGELPGTGTLIAESNTVNLTSYTWYDFDIEATIDADTFYTIETIQMGGTDWLQWGVAFGTGTYTDGRFYDGYDGWYDTSDTMFRIYDKYQPLGHIHTDNFDIGEVPTVAGEWAIEDITPDDSTLVYEAWYSTTGAFGGEEVSIGTIIDGQAITDLKRYWRVTATFAANTVRDETPTLQSIKADYTIYRRFNKIPDLGYEPLVTSLSSLTSKVDFFKPASIGQISIGIQMTDAVSDWVYADTLYNKIVQVKLGFKYDGFGEADYIHYFTGAIDDWSVNDRVLNLTLKDLSKDWKLPVPSKWEDAGDDVTWTDAHHIDVMLDIFQNHINVRDSGLLLDSFATVKAATSGYNVTRIITGSPVDAKKLVEELRVLLFAFFMPRGDGKIGIKQFDSTEAIVTTFTDDNTMGIRWKANSKDLINRTSIYFDWDGAGENESDFAEYDPGDDTTSQTKFQEIKPYILKDKWTDVAEATQISGLETKILDQFDDMPSSVTINCDAKDIAYEAGDMVGVTTLEAPGNGGAGIVDEKYLLISKNLDFLGDKIVFEGLRVAV